MCPLRLTVPELKRYLSAKQPAQLRALETPPPLIAEMWESEQSWDAAQASAGAKAPVEFYDFWLRARDLDVLEQWIGEEAAAREAEGEVDANVVTAASLARWGWQDYEDTGIAILGAAQRGQDAEHPVARVDLPPVPIEQRPLEVLLREPDVWGFSKAERALVIAAWKHTLRTTAAVDLAVARDVLETARKEFQDEKVKVSRAPRASSLLGLLTLSSRILQERVALARGFNIIGCTTTGAASFSELLTVSV